MSNWNLDAAMMNRGIVLSMTEPTEEEFQETALEIAKSYRCHLEKEYKVVFEDLGHHILSIKKI